MCRGRESSSSVANKGKSGNWRQFSPALVNKTGFIGIWAFILAYIWTNHINKAPGTARARPVEIWQRFPKFILGFLVTFAIGLALAFGIDPADKPKLAASAAEANTFRVIFFILTF